MNHNSLKKKLIISTASCLALASIFVSFSIKSNANARNSLVIPKTTTNPQTVFITLKDKNAVFGLRKYPKVNTESNVAVRLKAGTQVIAYDETVVNEKITWVKVKASNQIGWVNKKCLTEKFIDERDNYWRYASEESKVTIKKERVYKNTKFESDAYIATVKIQKATQFKHVYATKELDVKAGVVRDTVVNMTKKYSPIIAINATGFDKENKNCPRGTVGSRGKIDYFDSSRPSVALAYDGTLNIVNTTTEKTYAKPNNPFWVASFMPILVNNGKITQNEQNNLKKIDPAPRVAIGQKDNKNEFMIILVDGRRSDSPGINYYQMAKLFYDRGCKVAYNLDGGGSATMVFNGKIINKPSDPSGPRPVIDSLFVRDIN